MKTDKKTGAAMSDRMKWLNGWLRGRNYDISTKRKDFIFFYYCTLRVLYGSNDSRQMLLEINQRLVEPLDEYAVNSIIRTVNHKRGYRIRNSTIIDTLGITPAEIESLRIGHNLAEQAAREQRRSDRNERDEQIIKMFQDGYRTAQIAAVRTDVSPRTIERVIKEQSRAKKQERNSTIFQLAASGKSVAAIAEEVGCSKPTVRSVLSGKKPTEITRTENYSAESDAASFVDPIGMELFSRYKAQTAQAVREDYNHALSELQTTRQNVRIVGTGGTGKTQLINDYLAALPPDERNNTLVVAPTGLAASHIDGLTIHKAFGLSNEAQTRESPQNIPKDLKNLHRVIIDEISMLRIDLFEQVVTILQSIEAQEQRHIQLIVLGDFGQLEPVCTKEDKKLLRQLYPAAKGIYAFHSELWDKLNFQPIVLKYNFRQADLELSEQLTALKYGSMDAVRWFNRNSSAFTDDRAVYICPRNKDVEKYNRAALERFQDKKITVFKAKSDEIAPNTELPCPKELHLVEGMRVMTVVNDRKYKNGSIGTILQIKPKSIRVLFDNGTVATVHRRKFSLSDGSSYEQLPVVLAYAFTVHKCQGCTFDAVVIVTGFFAAGQLYTALSRCRSIDGICIDGILTEEDLIIDLDALKMTV